MDENEMKASAYTEQHPQIDNSSNVPVDAPLNATDGLIPQKSGTSPFVDQRPDSSSSNESE